MILGVIRAGFIPFLISPRNSTEAIIHLLKQGNARMVYSSNDDATRHKVESSGLSMRIMPTFDELYSPDAVFELLPDMPDVDMNSTAVIFHSSGKVYSPSLHTLRLISLSRFYCVPKGHPADSSKCRSLLYIRHR